MRFHIYILTIIIAFTSIPNISYTQTQEEIKEMQNEGEKDKKKKKEVKKKDKTPKEKNTKKNQTKKLENNKEDGNKDSNFSKLNYNQSKKVGDKLSEKGSFFNSLSFYKESLTKAKNDNQKVYAYNKLGDANFFLRDYKLAAVNYNKAMKLNTKDKKYPLLEYQLANTYKFLGQYDTAIVIYKQFLKKQSENKKVAWAISKTRREIKGCKYALEYVNEDPEFQVENAGENINGPFSDYGPELVGENTLYFSKINSDKVIILNDEIKEKDFSQIYTSDIHDDNFGMFQDFDKKINQKNTHVGNPSFTKDGNTVYFTKCTLNKEMQSSCKIYKSEKTEDIWCKAIELPSSINEEKTNSTQPHIVELEDEQILYFVSNRKGRGGKDIWYVKIDNEGKLSRVRSAGYPVNTAYDEVSPFYNVKTKTLYFSSNGHTNFGGLDIFKVSKDEEGNWAEEVENMGLPLNSSLDDYDFVIKENNSLGFLTSNRVGTTTLKSETCCDDIFKVSPTHIEVTITGTVFEKNETDRKALKNVDLFLFDKKTNTKIQEIPNKDGVFSFIGTKDMEYKILAIANDYENYELLFNTNGAKNLDEMKYDIFMDKNKKLDLTGRVLAIIFYEFDIAKLRSDSPDSLRKVVSFMKRYPNIIVEVGSHTDSKGSEEYNIALSERRSLSVKNYLIYQEKIPKDRLVHKSYGETQPAELNTNMDGSDNKEGRDLNRRTEFKVIGYLKE